MTVRLLIGLHHLELGGSQLNALDLAVMMRDRGHHVEVFGTHAGAPGPVAGLVRERGLPLTLAEHPLERTRRAALYRPAVARRMAALARDRHIDVVHLYEYPLILDALYGPHLRLGIPLVGTVYTVDTPRWLPRHTPLIVGTQEMVDQARACGQRVTLIEPPIDTDLDNPAAVDGAAFRRDHGIAPSDILLVIVSRLEPVMKAEGIERTMEALRHLGTLDGLRLAVVGTGPSYDALAARAAQVNAAVGEHTIVLPGPLTDPRPAYAAADVVLGMGGGGLRGMSFGKPLIVLGTGGFSRPFEESTVETFRLKGCYGVGAGIPDPDPLVGQIAALAADPGRRAEVGAWSRRLICDRFSLHAAADRLGRVYADALAGRAGSTRRLHETTRTAVYRAAAEIVPEGTKTHLRPLVRTLLGQAGSRS